MSAKKPKKNGVLCLKCENCQCVMTPKDLDHHNENGDCAKVTSEGLETFAKLKYPCVHNETLYGTLTTCEEKSRNNEVFLSEPVMDLCDFSYGSDVFVKDLDTGLTFIRSVHPSKDKHLMSIKFTKFDLQKTFCKDNIRISVTKTTKSLVKAANVIVVCLNFNENNWENTFLDDFLGKHFENSLLKVGLRFSTSYFGEKYRFEVKSIERMKDSKEDFINELSHLTIEDSEFYKVVNTTKWHSYRNKAEYENETKFKVKLTKIGALESQVSQMRRLMGEVFTNTRTNKVGCGVLLHGFPGTGKTLLAKTLAREHEADLIELTFDQVSEQFSDSTKINQKYIHGNKPMLILLDRFELFCPVKANLNRDERLVTQGLTNLFNSINNVNSKVFLIAITNKLDLVNHCFRKFPYLYPEIEVPIPIPEGRLEILKNLVNGEDFEFELSENELQEIANSTHGYVGLDLQCLWIAVLQKTHEHGKVNFEDFKAVLSTFKPQAMRDSNLKVPNVKWSDIGGQEKLKKTLRLAIEMPIKFKDKMKLFGLKPLKGVLMFGPPGCSKTMIGKAMATESGLNFFSVNGSELYSKWVGDSERAVKEIFRKARQVAPSVIFFDEFDALGAERSNEASSNVQDRVLSQLLTEFDGIHSTNDVIVIAATNRPEKIDKALLRPGRFDRIVYVPLPDANTRREIFKIKLLNRPITGVDIDFLVKATEDYSGAEINEIYSMAATMALEEGCEVIEFRHFTESLELITPMTSPSLLKIYEEFKCFCR